MTCKRGHSNKRSTACTNHVRKRMFYANIVPNTLRFITRINSAVSPSSYPAEPHHRQHWQHSRQMAVGCKRCSPCWTSSSTVTSPVTQCTLPPKSACAAFSAARSSTSARRPQIVTAAPSATSSLAHTYPRASACDKDRVTLKIACAFYGGFHKLNPGSS